MKRALFVVAALVVVFMGTCFGVGLAYEGSSVFDNTSPESQVTGLIEKYPSNRYGLDWHVGDVVTTKDLGLVDVPSGLNVDNAQMKFEHKLTSTLWDGVRIMNIGTITLFSWAFSLDIINGPNGLMRPIVESMKNLRSALGDEWMSLGFVLLGGWAAWRIHAKREHASTGSQLGMSLVYVLGAIFFAANMPYVLGGAFKVTNELANGLLGAMNGQSIRDAKVASANSMFETLVYDPWVVLNFGGMSHCVDKNDQWVKVSSRECAKKIDNKKKYADRWLKAGTPNSPKRKLEYEALRDGKIPPVTSAGTVRPDPNLTPQQIQNDPALSSLTQFDGYQVGPEDKPAVDIQQGEASGERLMYTGFVAGMSLGAAILIGGMSIGVILAAIMALFLAVATPIMMMAGMMPNIGHAIFRSWLKRLVEQPIKIVVYAIILSMVMAISNGIMKISGDLGWVGMAILMIFYWLAVIKRRQIQMTFRDGQSQDKTGSESLRDLYYAKRNMRMFSSPLTAPLKGAGAVNNAANSVAQGAVSLAKDGADEAKSQVEERTWKNIADGHSSAMSDAGSLRGAALQELEGAYQQDRSALDGEDERRATLANLTKRDQMSQDSIRSGERYDGMLDERERRTLSQLREGGMPQEEYEAVRRRVSSRESKRDEEGNLFSEAEVEQRSREISSRNGGHQGQRASRPHARDDLTRRVRRFRGQQERPINLGKNGSRDDVSPRSFSSLFRRPPGDEE